MKSVLVIGTRSRLDEFKELNVQNAEISYCDQFYLELEEVELHVGEVEVPNDEYYIADLDPSAYEVIFDLTLDENPENIDNYAFNDGQIIIGSAVKRSLTEIAAESGYDLDCRLYGMNALPTFINRAKIEMSLYNEADRDDLLALMEGFGLEAEIVDDRVGMVTPRVICMIINEACNVLQEGTADIPAVDQAMKLGTNYPMGPFEWADKMGVHNVYGVVRAMKAETGEEKYKVAPLLKKYFLRGWSFYGN